jgi:uncharacterized protein (DUF433 family)
MSQGKINQDFPELTNNQILACPQYAVAKGKNTKIVVAA